MMGPWFFWQKGKTPLDVATGAVAWLFREVRAPGPNPNEPNFQFMLHRNLKRAQCSIPTEVCVVLCLNFLIFDTARLSRLLPSIRPTRKPLPTRLPPRNLLPKKLRRRRLQPRRMLRRRLLPSGLLPTTLLPRRRPRRPARQTRSLFGALADCSWCAA